MLLFQLPQALSRTLFSSLAGRIEHQRLGLSVRVIAAGAAITAAAGGLLFVLAQPLISILYGPASCRRGYVRVLLVGAFAVLGARDPVPVAEVRRSKGRLTQLAVESASEERRAYATGRGGRPPSRATDSIGRCTPLVGRRMTIPRPGRAWREMAVAVGFATQVLFILLPADKEGGVDQAASNIRATPRTGWTRPVPTGRRSTRPHAGASLSSLHLSSSPTPHRRDLRRLRPGQSRGLPDPDAGWMCVDCADGRAGPRVGIVSCRGGRRPVDGGPSGGGRAVGVRAIAITVGVVTLAA
jgi:hypothetical protein